MRPKYPKNPGDFPKDKKSMKDMIEEKHGQNIHQKNWRVPSYNRDAYEEGYDRIFKKVVGRKPRKKSVREKTLKNQLKHGKDTKY